jgi:hypothetical protein
MSREGDGCIEMDVIEMGYEELDGLVWLRAMSHSRIL